MVVKTSMEKDWDARAKKDAFYYIDTSQSGWDENEFFREGERQAYSLTVGFLQEKGFDPKGKLMLDIGCGIGGLERGFSKMFAEVWGADVSGEMIKKAVELNQSENIHFVKANGYDLSNFADDFFDFVFSYRTFQHIPQKSITYNYFLEIHRVLKPGGLFKIHLRRRRLFTFAFRFMPIPTAILPYLPRWSRKIYWRLMNKHKGELARGQTWEGSAFRKSEALNLLYALGFVDIEVLEDHTHPPGTSFWCHGRKTM